MTSTTRIQRKYDHRLRERVRSTGNTNHAILCGAPRSTARSWLKSTLAELVSLDVVEIDRLPLQQGDLRLRNRLERLVTLLRVSRPTDSCTVHATPRTASNLFFGAEIGSASSEWARALQWRLDSSPGFNSLFFRSKYSAE